MLLEFLEYHHYLSHKWSQSVFFLTVVPAFPCIYLNILCYGCVGFETWDPDPESSALHSATSGESAWTLDHWASCVGWKHHPASSYSELTIPGECDESICFVNGAMGWLVCGVQENLVLITELIMVKCSTTLKNWERLTFWVLAPQSEFGFQGLLTLHQR